MTTVAFYSNNIISIGPAMDVIGIYLNFGEPCDVSLQGTFLNKRVVLKWLSQNTLCLISLHIKSNGVQQLWVQMYVV